MKALLAYINYTVWKASGYLTVIDLNGKIFENCVNLFPVKNLNDAEGRIVR